MNHFLEFIKTDLTKNRKAIHINSAKTKYELKTIKHHNSLLTRIFTYSTTAISLIIACIILIALIMAFKKYRYQRLSRDLPKVRINIQSLKRDELEETDKKKGQTSTEEFITLRG